MSQSQFSLFCYFLLWLTVAPAFLFPRSLVRAAPSPNSNANSKSKDGTANWYDFEELVLPALPYPYRALEPYLQERTLKFHHDKHHAKYVENTIDLISKQPHLKNAKLPEIIKFAASDPSQQALFNNAAQSFNHAFYWLCMKTLVLYDPTINEPTPDGPLRTAIDKTFGSLGQFRDEFVAKAVGVFGSGWVWLAVNEDGLKLIATPNAGCPIVDGYTPLLVIDVWEHAYYLEYQHQRPNYSMLFIDRLVNWNFVEAQFDKFLAQNSKQNTVKSGNLMDL